MADSSLLPALAGAVVGEVVERAGDGLAIGLRLAQWCGRPGKMPACATLAIDGAHDRAGIRARLSTLDVAGREIESVAEGRSRAGRRTLEIVLAGAGAPLVVECRDFSISASND